MGCAAQTGMMPPSRGFRKARTQQAQQRPMPLEDQAHGMNDLLPVLSIARGIDLPARGGRQQVQEPLNALANRLSFPELKRR